MSGIIQILAQIDWATLLTGVGVAASALGFGFGIPLITAGQTLKEVREIMEAAPMKNKVFQGIAKHQRKRKAQKELAKLSDES